MNCRDSMEGESKPRRCSVRLDHSAGRANVSCCGLRERKHSADCGILQMSRWTASKHAFWVLGRLLQATLRRVASPRGEELGLTSCEFSQTGCYRGDNHPPRPLGNG